MKRRVQWEFQVLNYTDKDPMLDYMNVQKTMMENMGI